MNQNQAPIHEAVLQYAHQTKTRMHMPAHKGKAACLAPFSPLLPLDVTELPATGSLFDGEGVTAQAERLAAELFGTAATRLSAGGSTLCIQAMLRLALPCGGKLLCARVVHRSAVQTMQLLGIEPIWLLPDISAGKGFAGRVTAQALQSALLQHPDAKAVYVTSPDYFGVLCDITALAAVAKKAGIPLLVDCAHGTHLRFLESDVSPTALGAAMCAQSAHKTLPALTGGAWLQIAQERYATPARGAMALFGSTSPSYLILQSLDLCRRWLAQEGAAQILAVLPTARRLREYIQALQFSVPEGACDPLHLTFSVEGTGLSARQAGEILRQNGVEPEYAGQGKISLLLSPADTPQDTERLKRALQSLAEERKTACTPEEIQSAALPERCFSPAETLAMPSLWLPVQQTLGEIAAQAVCPCPPGIPIVMPGEKIDASIRLQLKKYGIASLEVVNSERIQYNGSAGRSEPCYETGYCDCQQR